MGSTSATAASACCSTAPIGAGVVLVVGVVVPRVARHGADAPHRAGRAWWCRLALFLVGGWGLGRDIGSRAASRAPRRARRRSRREADRAQLLALRSHLDPHFLFNTLNAIAEWCREDGEVGRARGAAAVGHAAHACWTGVRARPGRSREELALLDTLFELHRLRDPDRLQLTRRLPEPLPDVAVPPMLLLPLAENAVKHGPAAGHGGDHRRSRCARSPPRSS